MGRFRCCGKSYKRRPANRSFNSCEKRSSKSWNLQSCFNSNSYTLYAIRELSGIPKLPKSKFPHVPLEYMDKPIIKKFNKDERMEMERGKENGKKLKIYAKHDTGK